MTDASHRSHSTRRRRFRLWRIGWVVVTVCTVQGVVCGLSILPVLGFWFVLLEIHRFIADGTSRRA